MLTSMGLVLTIASLARGQGPGFILEAPSPTPPHVEIIQPVIPDTSSESPPETHAPELPIPPEPRLWGRAEYLLWWVRDARLPPLVTTTPATVSQAVQGALTAPGTEVLFGGDGRYLGTFSGGALSS